MVLEVKEKNRRIEQSIRSAQLAKEMERKELENNQLESLRNFTEDDKIRAYNKLKLLALEWDPSVEIDNKSLKSLQGYLTKYSFMDLMGKCLKLKLAPAEVKHLLYELHWSRASCHLIKCSFINIFVR